MASTSFASLNPSLLARKGGAKPAMRPQIAPLSALPSTGDKTDPAERLEDLGWNDMGDDAAAAAKGTAASQENLSGEIVAINEGTKHQIAADRIVSQARAQQEALAQRIGAQDTDGQDGGERRASRASRRSAFSQGRRAAFTLRLDRERHLKLRLASAVSGQSAQQLLTRALDEMLERMDEVEELASKVKPKSQA